MADRPFSRVWLDGLPQGQMSDFLLAFGQDHLGEVYVLTTANLGPTGSTGRPAGNDAPA